MSYWNRKNSVSSPSLDSTSLSTRHGNRTSITDEFYEIEPAIVLDIILDKSHPYFSDKSFKLNPDQWPADINGKPPLKTDPDYTWVGRVLVRLIYSQANVEKENLIWAMPLESNISEYPVLNETVGVVFYLGQYYYTRKINTFNTVNADADFNSEINSGGFRNNPNEIVQGNRELILKDTDPTIPYIGPQSKLNILGSVGYIGALGRYFFYNPRIRSLKRREGDLVFESRFGQSIRFATYDDNRNNDKGYNSDFSGYTDYKGTGIQNPFSKTEAGGGNPMVLIRNRQRPLDKTNPDEKNVGGYMLEDVNNDGSSIHLTSGVTFSQFQTVCLKKMWGNGSEEQSNFNGTTTFKYPSLIGDQMVLNSDRVIISAKKNELFQYSKKRMSFVTDDEYTVDAQNQVVITTNNKTVLNSPAIYLGEYNQTNEPVLLGQTTVNWLYDLVDWLLIHTHWYKHTHPNVGQPTPPTTQIPVETAILTVLQSNLHTLMSRRVFVTGGGYAPGQNGGTIANGAVPVSIDVASGTGLPGGWNGSNRRYSASGKTGDTIGNCRYTDCGYVSHSKFGGGKSLSGFSPNSFEDSNIVTSTSKRFSNIECVNNCQTTVKFSKNKRNLGLQYAATAQTASTSAATTTNDILRMENEATARRADKAKYYANLADTQNKATQSAVSTAQTEVTKVLAQRATLSLATGTNNVNTITRFI